jgi:hypothetical protein
MHNIDIIMIFFFMEHFVGHHCMLIRQATGIVPIQLFGILSMLIVLFLRYASNNAGINEVVISVGLDLWEGITLLILVANCINI